MQAVTADGQPVLLEEHVDTPVQVLEVALRTPEPGEEGNFDAARAGFFGEVAEQPGDVFDREILTVDGQRVVMIGRESPAQLMTALGALSRTPQMGAFFGIIDASPDQAAVIQRGVGGH